MNTTHIKIESDALVCMICAAAFIGYALGIQKVVNVIKPHQYNKYSQTNLSELAEFLTSNHMIVNGDGAGENVQKHSNHSNATADVNSEEMKMNEVNNSVVDSRIVEEEDKGKIECQGMNSNKDNEKINENVSEIIMTNSGNVNNNSEEEYEVVTGNIKKTYTKKQPRYYFGWFDSIF
jgi:hypothetical protein